MWHLWRYFPILPAYVQIQLYSLLRCLFPQLILSFFVIGHACNALDNFLGSWRSNRL